VAKKSPYAMDLKYRKPPKLPPPPKHRLGADGGCGEIGDTEPVVVPPAPVLPGVISGFARGTAVGVVPATSIAVSPSQDFDAAAAAVLIAGYEVVGAGGDPFGSVTDSLGNTWTPRVVQGSAAGDLGLLRFFITDQDAAPLVASSVITLSFADASSTLKTLHLIEARNSAPGGVLFVASGSAASSGSGGSATVTTASITSGNLVVAAAMKQGPQLFSTAWTPDADTVSGVWSVAQSTVAAIAFGNSADLISQYKTVSGNVAQTYNPNHTEFRWQALGWIELAPA
jgi:hypothetical protein